MDAGDPSVPGWLLGSATFIGTAVGALLLRMGWKSAEGTKAASKSDAMIAAVGMGYGGSPEQSERLIQAVNGVAQAIRDKRNDEMQDTMNDLLEELKRREGR